MTIDEMNVRYGAPGRIVFRVGHCGYPNVVIANKYGSAEIALMGANVLSYRPTGHSEVIFRPAKRDYNRGESFHGGIPVCWPQFGNRFSKELPQHGFARIMPFAVKATKYTEDMTSVTLGLESDADTKTLWNHEFELSVEIIVSMKLTLKMTTVNAGAEPFDFSCGFHPYFLVRDRNRVTVKGLADLDFFNGVTGKADDRQSGDLTMDHATDHIFAMKPELKHELALVDDGLRRAIALVSSDNAKTVVWNPGEANPLPDFGPDDWRRFVCVEPVSDWPNGRTLAPGAKYELTAAIQANLADLER